MSNFPAKQKANSHNFSNRWIHYLLICSCWLSSSARAALASHDWSGVWETNWRDGSGRLILEQKGNLVTGRDQIGGGRLEATVRGARLEGRWIPGGDGVEINADQLVFVLGGGGRSFTGRANERGWWNGVRADDQGVPQALGLRSPRETFMNFLASANIARTGAISAWAAAARAVEFDVDGATLSRDDRFRRMREYFEIIDLTTFRAWDAPLDAPTKTLTLSLKQSRSGATLAVTLRRNEIGEWRVVVPTAESIDASRRALLAAYGASPPSSQSFTRLQSPRDAMRSFMAGVANWNKSGRRLAVSTLDLSGFPESLRESDAVLVAGYLSRTLGRIGFSGLQAIPNDGSVHDSYVHFVHDLGSIVIAPTGPEADAPWKFTVETVEHISELFMAVSKLPPAMESPPQLLVPVAYFNLREFVQNNAPWAMVRFRRVEVWQIAMGVIIVLAILIFMRAISGLAIRKLSEMTGVQQKHPRLLRWALTIVLAAGFNSLFLPNLIGIPENSRQYSMPILATIVFSSSAFLAWHIVSLLAKALGTRAARTARTSDDLAITLFLACARITIVFVAAIKIAYYFSIPTDRILAGIGISGLAIAFASRETLTNLFGAGVIMADRPFRRGDWIDCSFAQGFIEDMGIRSTRVRTADDSVVVVPNGKLAGAIINNLGRRRVRYVAVDMKLGVGAPPGAIEAFIAGVRSQIERNSLFVRQRTEIGLTELGAEGTAAIALRCYLRVSNEGDETKARHALLLELQNIAATSGVKLDSSRIVSSRPPKSNGDDEYDEGDDFAVGGP
jgi:MscS family membrane protein